MLFALAGAALADDAAISRPARDTSTQIEAPNFEIFKPIQFGLVVWAHSHQTSIIETGEGGYLHGPIRVNYCDGSTALLVPAGVDMPTREDGDKK